VKRLLLLGLVACDSDIATIKVELATAPGSTILDGVQTLRMEVTEPKKVVTAERTSDGFELGLDLPAEGTSAAIYVDGFDADGNLVANGATPRFALGGVDGRVVVYMAAPNSIDVAPVALSVARSGLAAGTLSYGAIFAGGMTEDLTASLALDIYNAYDHTLSVGLPLPAGRIDLALGVGTSSVYLYGGIDVTNALKSQLWAFNPGTPPSGSYVEYGDKAGFARGGAPLVPIGTDTFLLTGGPPLELRGLDGSLVEREGPILGDGVTVTANDGRLTSIFAGSSGVVRYRDTAFETLDATDLGSAVRVAAVPGGKAIVVCGGSTDALRIDAASGAIEPLAGIPSTAKTGCAVAATARHLLIAGGGAASVDATVEVYDAATYELVATATLAVPRRGAQAVPLANGQILIAGGVDASGVPVGTLELFTPLTR